MITLFYASLLTLLALTLAINSMRQNGQISNYDKYIGEKIAFVLSGGDTDINKELSEENILNLEKDAIYELISKNLTFIPKRGNWTLN